MNRVAITALVFGLAGCVAETPQPILDARAALLAAEQSRAPELAPSELEAARRAHVTAEQAFRDDGDDTFVLDLAYVAQRKAELATASAELAASMASKADADARLLGLATRTAEERTNQLESTTGKLDAEKKARAAAEARARDALERLQAFAAIREESRGTVITMPGSVLFESGKSSLLANAREKLNQVADALLAQRDARILIEGHTDSQGDETANRKLSEDRAAAVRSHLLGRGIAADRVVACGAGELRPVASNATPEGRADNRRVEIIVGETTTRLSCAL